MRSQEWERHQRDIDELFASYAFATAATGLLLLAVGYNAAAATAGVLHFFVRGIQHARAVRLASIAKGAALLHAPSKTS
jgi:hypothetical protein